MSTLAPVGACARRRTQRIRPPSRSRRGSTPKLFWSEVAHRSRRGFPEYSCSKRAKTTLLALVPHGAREAVAAIVRTVFAQPDHASALAQL